MIGGNPDPGLVKHFCRCGAFYASHMAWFFHRDAGRIGCREVGHREWAQLHAARPVAAA